MSSAKIYARYGANDSVIYTGITGRGEIVAGTPAPPGASESNAFLQSIVFCGGSGGGVINQTITTDGYTSQRWWDKNYAAGPFVQGEENYHWGASGGARVEVLFEPEDWVSYGDSIDIVNCLGTYTHYGFDDADPNTNIAQMGRWDATPGVWSKYTSKSYPQGYIAHIFFGDDPEVVCIVEQSGRLVENLSTIGVLNFYEGVGIILDKDGTRIDHNACQIFGYGFWPDTSFVCRDTVADAGVTTGEVLHYEYSEPKICYNWPGGTYIAHVVPNWVSAFSLGTATISHAPYMNTSYGGLAVLTDYRPPGLLSEAVFKFGCWEGGT